MAGKEKNVAGNIWREKNRGNILAVNSLGGKFSRRYIFFGGEVEPTHFGSLLTDLAFDSNFANR